MKKINDLGKHTDAVGCLKSCVKMLCSLPDDLLLHVASFLPYSSIARLELVIRKQNEPVSQLLKASFHGYLDLLRHLHILGKSQDDERFVFIANKCTRRYVIIPTQKAPMVIISDNDKNCVSEYANLYEFIIAFNCAVSVAREMLDLYKKHVASNPESQRFYAYDIKFLTAFVENWKY